jgi:hypothetical protein
MHSILHFVACNLLGKPGIALGWGSTSWPLLRYPVDLQQVELPIIDNPRCDAVMGGITDDMLCAGDGLGERDKGWDKTESTCIRSPFTVSRLR